MTCVARGVTYTTRSTCGKKGAAARFRCCSCIATMSDEESSDEEYDFHDTGNDLQGEDVEARFPIHDCCEFEDIEALKVRS